MTYVTIFRCFSDLTYVKIIKNYSLTRQRENSTHSERSAPCRTRQYLRITLKRLKKKTTATTKNKKQKILTKRLLKKHRYIYVNKKMYKYAAVHYWKDLPFFSVHLYAKSLRGSKTS